MRFLLLCACLLIAVPASAQQDPGNVGARLLQDSAVKAAIERLRASEPQTIEDQVLLCEVEAPPFKETRRAQLYAQMFKEIGLTNVRIDKEGNVLGEKRGAQPRPHLVFSAHLDTVFPEGTNVTVKREGTMLRAPGIGDDCRGLAVVLAVARTMIKHNIQTPGTITFVGNVGYRVTFKGPGGHSYGAFGMVNPIQALGRAMARIADFQVPTEPKTTFNVGRIGGGTSVNAIPFEAWAEIDMRSADAASLQSVDAKFHKALDEAVVDE